MPRGCRGGVLRRLSKGRSRCQDGIADPLAQGRVGDDVDVAPERIAKIHSARGFVEDSVSVSATGATESRRLRSKAVPTISVFYGIVISMFFNDHEPPHIHARYAEHEARIAIATGTSLTGHLPPRAARLVR